jgi:hypothetical protein
MKSRVVRSFIGRVHFCLFVYAYVYRFAVYVYGSSLPNFGLCVSTCDVPARKGTAPVLMSVDRSHATVRLRARSRAEIRCDNTFMRRPDLSRRLRLSIFSQTTLRDAARIRRLLRVSGKNLKPLTISFGLRRPGAASKPVLSTVEGP